jgi:hypothetical protein
MLQTQYLTGCFEVWKLLFVVVFQKFENVLDLSLNSAGLLIAVVLLVLIVVLLLLVVLLTVLVSLIVL